MNQQEYESLQGVFQGETVLRVVDLANPMEDRTILFGYTPDRLDHHVYLMQGELYLRVGDPSQPGFSQTEDAQQRDIVANGIKWVDE